MTNLRPGSIAARIAVLAGLVAAITLAGPIVDQIADNGRSAAVSAQSMPADEFNRRVRDYILENPEIIAEAMQRLEERREVAHQLVVQKVLKTQTDELLRDPESPVAGNPNGDVTIVEFFDYNCPYCRRVIPAMKQAIAADPQLRIVYKEFPILGRNSMFAAKAGLAAHRQDRSKYLAFHEALMKPKGPTTEQRTLAAAEKVGLDVKRLKADMDSPEIAAAIARNIKLAQALQIRGTPGFVIGDQIIPGAVDLETLQSVVDEARQAKKH